MTNVVGPPTEVVTLAPGAHVVAAVTPASASAPATLTYPNAGVLQGQGVWMLGPAVAVPAGAKRVSFDCTYTGTGPTSQVKFRVQWGHASNRMGVEPVDDTTIALDGAVGTQNEFDRVRNRPVSGASPMNWTVEVDVRAEPFVAIDFAELVQDANGAGSMTTVSWIGAFS